VVWRSSSKWLLLILALAGCGRFAVRPNEKEHLADRTMKFDGDAQESASDDHVLSNREGSAGGKGTGGGGCGCN
jgi:hypothetical protein